MSGKDEAGAAVPAAQRSSWTQFVKSIASVSGDLSSMTAPPFILSPVSLTEYPSYWGERPQLFAVIADGPTPEERHLRVVKWFISTLKGQYTSRNEKMGSEKKPLNPVLGEIFKGKWPDTGFGEQTLFVEQVSHHPPITAYYIENKSKGLVLQGHNAQKTSFSSGSIVVKQIGHATLTLTLKGGEKETYILTLPRLRIDGIWYGSPYIELTDTSYISSSTGYMTSIEYRGKGYFSGKSHSFKASIFAPLPRVVGSDPNDLPTLSTTPKFVAEGTWTEQSKLRGTGAPFTDVSGPKFEIEVIEAEDADPYETRVLWREVAKGIRSGDFEAASREKSKIENAEREKRKEEKAAEKPWELRFFKQIESDPDYERLGKLFNAVPATEDTYVYVGGASA